MRIPDGVGVSCSSPLALLLALGLAVQAEDIAEVAQEEDFCGFAGAGVAAPLALAQSEGTGVSFAKNDVAPFTPSKVVRYPDAISIFFNPLPLPSVGGLGFEGGVPLPAKLHRNSKSLETR